MLVVVVGGMRWLLGQSNLIKLNLIKSDLVNTGGERNILQNFNITFALGKAIRLQLRKTSNSFPLGFQVSSSDTSGESGIDLKIMTIRKHNN